MSEVLDDESGFSRHEAAAVPVPQGPTAESWSSSLCPQSSFLQPLSSVLSPPASVLRPQSSSFCPQSSVLQPQSSVLRPPASSLHPPSSILVCWSRTKNKIVNVTGDVPACIWFQVCVSCFSTTQTHLCPVLCFFTTLSVCTGRKSSCVRRHERHDD